MGREEGDGMEREEGVLKKKVVKRCEKEVSIGKYIYKGVYSKRCLNTVHIYYVYIMYNVYTIYTYYVNKHIYR